MSRKITRTNWSPAMIIAVIFLFSIMSPLMSYVGHGLKTSWPIFGVWIYFTILEKRNLSSSIKKEIYNRRFELCMFSAWLFLIFFNYALGRGYTGLVHLQVTLTLGMVLCVDIFYTAKNNKSHEAIQISVLILVGLEVTRSLGTLFLEPSLVRQAMYLGGQSELYARTFLSSVGDYGYYTGLALAIPVMVALWLKQEGILRIVLLPILVMISVSIILSSFLGATLLMVLGFCLLILLVILFGKNRLRWIVLFSLIILLAIYIWGNYLASTIQATTEIDKFILQTNSVMQYGLIEGDLTNRAGLWLMSWRTFLDHPFLGIGPITGQNNLLMGVLVGGHSTWLDIPAQYGLIGLFFVILFILLGMKRGLANLWTRKGRRDIKNLARLSVCFLYIIAGTYNPTFPGGVISYLFFFFVIGGISKNATH